MTGKEMEFYNRAVSTLKKEILEYLSTKDATYSEVLGALEVVNADIEQRMGKEKFK